MMVVITVTSIIMVDMNIRICERLYTVAMIAAETTVYPAAAAAAAAATAAAAAEAAAPSLVTLGLDAANVKSTERGGG